MKMQHIIGALTVLLIVVGLIILLGGAPGEQRSFEDVESYRSERAESEWAASAPSLPSCASSITVTVEQERVSSVAFTCTDTAARTSFLANIRRSFEWNVLTFDGGRVRLEAVNER